MSGNISRPRGGAAEAIVDRVGEAVLVGWQFHMQVPETRGIELAEHGEEPAGDPAEISAGVEPADIGAAPAGRS